MAGVTNRIQQRKPLHRHKRDAVQWTE